MAIIRLNEAEDTVALFFTTKAARHLYAFMEDVVQYDVVQVGQTDELLAELIIRELDTKELEDK